MRALVFALTITGISAFQPEDKAELETALATCCDNDTPAFDNECTYQGSHISQWDTSQVTDFQKLFDAQDRLCFMYFDADIRLWDVTNVQHFNFAFRGTMFNQDISGWNVKKDLSYGHFFHSFSGAFRFNQNLDAWGLTNPPYKYIFIGSNSMVHRPSWYDDVTEGCWFDGCGTCKERIKAATPAASLPAAFQFIYHDNAVAAGIYPLQQAVVCTEGYKENTEGVDCSATLCVDNSPACCEPVVCEGLDETGCFDSGTCWWHKDDELCKAGHKNKALRDHDLRITKAKQCS